MNDNFQTILMLAIPLLILGIIWFFIRSFIARIIKFSEDSDTKIEILNDIKNELQNLNSKMEDLEEKNKKNS